MENKVLTQEEIISAMLPILKSEGKIYKKVTQVLARKAKEGELIHTVTSDGHETSNKAQKGDFIIKNQTRAGEMYIINAGKFHDRYDFHRKEENGFSIYNAKGKILAVEMTVELLDELNLGREFRFIATWNEPMVVKTNDFLVCQLDFSSVYRIAHQEFLETYQPE